MRFKHDRIRQLGWLQNSEIDSQNDVKDLDFVLFDDGTNCPQSLEIEAPLLHFIHEVDNLIQEMKLVMEVKQSARTKLAVRFYIYCTDLDELITLRSKERKYEEADRLKQLRNSIQLLITDNKLDEHLDYIRSLVTSKAARTVSAVAIEEDQASRRQDFLTPVTGAQALRDLLKSLTNEKDALSRELNCFPKKTLLSLKENLDIWYLWTRTMVDTSSFALARQANEVELLIQVHKLSKSLVPNAPTLSYSVDDLKANGYSASELKALGYSKVELKTGGYIISEMKDAGFSLYELKEAGYAADEMKAARYTAKELKSIGYSLLHLIEAGYAVVDLRIAGYKPLDLTTVGYSYWQLRNAGYSASDFLDRNDSRYGSNSSLVMRELMTAGYTTSELRTAGCTPSDLMSIGLTGKQFKEAGFNALELKDAGFTLRELKELGFHPEELQSIGFSLKELNEVGFTLYEILSSKVESKAFLPSAWIAKRRGSTVKQLKDDGYSLDVIKSVGYTIAEIKIVNYSKDELLAAGYTVKELKAGGYDVNDFKKAGYLPRDLKGEGFTFLQMSHGGYNSQELRGAGFTM
jgi:ribosomal protein L13E